MSQKKAGLNRSFGLVLAGVFALLGTVAYSRGRATFVHWGVLAGLFLLISLTMPRVLAPLRRSWLTLGRLLGRVTNPVLLGAVYAVMIVPVGAMMRLFRRDPLTYHRPPFAASYWVETTKKIDADSLKEQF
jgi:hypothetical protein